MFCCYLFYQQYHLSLRDVAQPETSQTQPHLATDTVFLALWLSVPFPAENVFSHYFPTSTWLGHFCPMSLLPDSGCHEILVFHLHSLGWGKRAGRALLHVVYYYYFFFCCWGFGHCTGIWTRNMQACSSCPTSLPVALLAPSLSPSFAWLLTPCFSCLY